MRFTSFMRKAVASGEVQAIPFAPAHFREAGVSCSLAAGMPILEAYQLVNKWNVSQTSQAFVYALL